MIAAPFAGLPDHDALSELKAISRWICWRWDAPSKEGEKPPKRPASPHTGWTCDAHNPKSWATYEKAAQTARRRKFAGVGFVLVDSDDIYAVDLDACVKDGELADWARAVVDLGETYAEISPSGTGVRMIGRGEIETTKTKGVELYAAKQFVTITGNHVPGAADTIGGAPATLEALLARAEALRPAPSSSPSNSPSSTPSARSSSTTSLDELAELLSYIPATEAYPRWTDALMALHAATGGSEAGLNIADEWSATGGDLYKGRKDVERKWRSFKAGGGITRGTLAKLAKEYGADLSAIAIKHMPEMPDDGFDASQLTVGGRKPGEAQSEPEPTESAGDEPELPPLPVIAEVFDLETPDYPPGLVGDIARYIVAGGRRPQPAMAIGAALTLVGTMAGRLYRGPTGGGTNLYLLGLAPTAGGKNAPLEAVKEFMRRAELADHLGPSEFISMPAVVGFMKSTPLALCPMDEFGDFMSRINAKRASNFERAVNKLIREMWSEDFKTYTTPQWAQTPCETIHSPCLSIFGASTPAQFYDSMKENAIEDGTLNRFLLVGGNKLPKRQRPKKQPDVAEAIASKMRDIYFAQSGLSEAYRNDPKFDPVTATHGPIDLEWGEGAEARFEAILDDIEPKLEDAKQAPFWGRTGEQAVRLATIIAIGCGSLSVDVDELEWGYRLASNSARFMLEGVERHMAESDHEALLKKILRTIERGEKVGGERTPGRASYRYILRLVKVKSRDLQDALEQLYQSGQLIRQTDKRSKTGPSFFIYQIADAA